MTGLTIRPAAMADAEAIEVLTMELGR